LIAIKILNLCPVPIFTPHRICIAYRCGILLPMCGMGRSVGLSVGPLRNVSCKNSWTDRDAVGTWAPVGSTCCSKINSAVITVNTCFIAVFILYYYSTPWGVQSIVIGWSVSVSVCVCVSVYVRAYLQNSWTDLHEIFCTWPLGPWLGPLTPYGHDKAHRNVLWQFSKCVIFGTFWVTKLKFLHDVVFVKRRHQKS